MTGDGEEPAKPRRPKPSTGRTVQLPDGIVSGFRRLPQHQDAALVSEIAALLDPPPDDAVSQPALDPALARKLAAIDAAADAIPLDPKRLKEIKTWSDQYVRFALASDVIDARSRWRAIIARAFAAADTIAWCLAEGFEDDAALVDWADKIEKSISVISPDLGGKRFDEAWRRRYFLRREIHEEMTMELYDVANYLEDRARRARDCAAETTDGGRSPMTPRTFFVLRLARIYQTLSGHSPELDGGDLNKMSDRHGPRKRAPSGWHLLINAALDITKIRAGARTNSILVLASKYQPAFMLRDDYDPLSLFLADSVKDLEDSVKDLYVELFFDLGLATDVGFDFDKAPKSRADAYAHPQNAYKGRTYLEP